MHSSRAKPGVPFVISSGSNRPYSLMVNSTTLASRTRTQWAFTSKISMYGLRRQTLRDAAKKTSR